jgi:MFS family permease
MMGLVSLGFIILGSFLVVVSDLYPLMLVGRLIGGLGWSLLPVVGLQAIAKWFSGNRLALAMGIYNTFVFLSIIISLNTMGLAGLEWGWRSAVWITIGITVVTIVIFAFLFKEPEQKTERPSSSPKTLLKMSWPVWIVGLSWGLFSFGVASMTTFMPDFLYSSGFALSIAGSVTSILIICTAILSPLSGYILDKTNYKQIFVVVGGAISSVFVFLLPANVEYIIPILSIIGITTASFVTVFLAVIPSMVKPEFVALAYGLITTFNTIGSFIGPYMLGYIRDITESYESGFWMIAVVFIIIALLAVLLLFKEIRLNRLNKK